MKKQKVKKASLLKSVLGIVLLLIVFFVLWALWHWFFSLFSGSFLYESKLYAFLLMAAAPALAGYFAMDITESRIKNASIQIVFYGFAVIMLIGIGIYIGGALFKAFEATFLLLVSPLFGIAGVYAHSYDKIHDLW